MRLMTSNKPYLIRAMFDWIIDNNCTPHLVVDATLPFVEVPEQYIDNGRIILNIAPGATQSLLLGDDWITFSARFSGVKYDISLPIGAIAAIYAQENAQGMGFETEALLEDEYEEKATIAPSKTSKPILNIVEDHNDDDHDATDYDEDNALDNRDDAEHDDDEPTPPTKKRGKPTLKIIK